MTEREYRLKIKELEQEIQDLKVVLNTAQTALRSVDSTLKNDTKIHSDIFTTSAKWAMNYPL
jgi:hypothetical protein